MASRLSVPDHPAMGRRTLHQAIYLALLCVLALACTLGALSAVALSAEPSQGEEFRVPTVLEAIDLALVNGPDMASALRGVEQAQLGAAAARSALSWRVDAAGAHSLEHIEPTTEHRPDPEDTQTTASLTLQRTLAFDPQVKNQLRKADLGAEQAMLMLESAAHETVKAVFQAYRELELALIRRQVLSESVRVAAMSWEAAQARAQDGTLSKEDAEGARLDLAAAELEYLASERMLEVARLALAQRLGLDDLPPLDEAPVPTLEELKDAIVSKAPAYWPEQPAPWGAGLDELKEQAISDRPDVRLALAQVRQAEIDVELARLARRPVFMAEATYTKAPDGEANLSLNSRGGLSATINVFDLYESAAQSMPFDSQWEVRIGASVNLWDSAQNALEVRRATSALDEARSALNQAKSGVELDVSSRHISAVSAHGRLRLASERVLLALDRLEAERRRLELGFATPLSVAAKELDVHAAVVQAFAARVEFEKSVVELAVSAGMPLDQLRELIAAF